MSLSLLTSGLARRRRQDSDWEYAFYSSSRRLWAWPRGGCSGARSWKEMFLSKPSAADFGPGLKVAAEGRWEFAVYASRHQLQA